MQEITQNSSSRTQKPVETLVVGHSVTVANATLERRFASWLTDSSITVAAWTTTLGALQAPLTPPVLHLVGALTLAAAIRWIQRRTLGSTLSDRLWGIRPEIESSGKRILRQTQLPVGTRAARTFFSALTALGLPSMSLLFLSHSHPSLMEGSHETLAVQPPPSSAEWPNLPFYYLLGPWPAKVDGHPVTYSLPYAKGPPKKFIGSVLMHWRGRNEATLQLDGPKTPQNAANPAALKQCFTPGWRARAPLPCLSLREQALKNILESLRLRFPFEGGQNWTIGWFETPTENDPEPLQGIHIQAKNAALIEDHYVAVTTTGTHQDIRLTREAGPQSLETESLFLAALGTQKVQKEIAQSRAWADQLLASVELSSLQALENQPEAWSLRAAEIESFLISKLTVDPTAIEPFFHLGGIATLFARQGTRLKNPEWTQHASGLLQAVIRYAHDVAPQDHRVSQLEKIRGELQAPGDQVAPRTPDASHRASPVR